MKDYGRRGVMLAATLSALAGYVDAVGFMTLGGFFVSFMSGNLTRLGVGAATDQWLQAGVAGGLIGLFVVGVIVGATVARRVGEERRSAVLAVEALLLLLGAGLCTVGQTGPGMVAVVMAMGVENAVFQRQGDVGVGLTYMTGTLVRMGQRIATALHGGPRWDWVPFLMLWLGLAAGGAVGAVVFLKLGVLALWPAFALVAVLSLLVARAERRSA
ncbi:YoaK family protein [Roseibacterium beibuensis]|uniref:YoaK family protein n=1 Tax=[Roseibacterium] beibuensis TaxID=1193142 RepID=UPI00217E6BF1|nr:YoaK family protein [Roseibacterium beibuensis]MCS6624971.1 YoaK family protein [Roseibacterium beibuensis]